MELSIIIDYLIISTIASIAINSVLLQYAKQKKLLIDIPDKNRCCARIMGERYSDQRCPYHKVKDDYCKIHQSIYN